MDESVAETLPERYRGVLDRIADLETCGRRREADEIRRQAIRAYSRAWTARTAHRLDSLARRAEALIASAAMDRRTVRGWPLTGLVRRRVAAVPLASEAGRLAAAGDPPAA